MLATKIIYGIYSSFKNGIKYAYNFLINISDTYKQTLSKVKEYIEDFKYKINHLREANFELGLYHLNRLNLSDAIIRFKLIDKFFNKDDKQANYWLGWCYFLKNNFEAAAYHLKKAGDADLAELQLFIQNHSDYAEVPEKIIQQYRDIIVGGKDYFNKFQNEKIYLPTLFVQKVLEEISDLPDEYKILEINIEVGLIGQEIKKRFPEDFKLTGIEISKKMLEVSSVNKQSYDELQNISLQKIASAKRLTKFDVILSFCGLVYAKRFEDYLQYVKILLNDKGYFAFCLSAYNQNMDLLNKKEYAYNPNEIQQALAQNDFNLLKFEELKLGINNKYYIYICRKA